MAKAEQVLGAQGRAATISLVAEADALALSTIGKTASTSEGARAVMLTLAQGHCQSK